ncbi:MAG: hypothetical protein M1840_006928 [Geoglossum simile]|nr:MAG: hypothetical protein M1840_006928 [Geoglossum simile]
MTDPLSVTGSVISLGLIACRGLLQYYTSWKGYKDDVATICDSLEGLTRTLQLLETSIRANGLRPEIVASIRESIKLCEGGVGYLQRKLDKIKDTKQPGSWEKARSHGKRMAYPFKESTLAKLREVVSELRDDLGLAVGSLQVDTSATCLRKLDGITGDLTQISVGVAMVGAGIGALVSSQKDEYRQKVYHWLSPPDPTSSHIAACKKRQPTTGSWFTRGRKFAKWKATPDSMIWLSTIIEDVKSHCQQAAIAFFYFEFSDEKKQRLENFTRSLIAQLSAQSTSAPKFLEELYARHQNGQQKPSTEELVAALEGVVDSSQKTYIILDALDECTEREELLSLIKQMAQWKTGKLHILATSRRERDISEALNPLTKDEICIQSGLVKADIQLHIRERLQHDQKLEWPAEVQDELEETLMEGAHGMFRWVVCQLEALRTCRNIKELRERLKTLPKTLDETYDRILANINENDSQSALRVLQWLTFSMRPMRVEEVAEALAVDMEGLPRFDLARRFRDPRDVLDICSSLVTLSPATIGCRQSEIEELRLAHFSVKEYLVSERPAPRYRIREISANVSIADACLAYLLQFECPNSLSSQTAKEYPLARYAAKYWFQHAQLTEAYASTTPQLIMQLLLSEVAYVNWVRLFNPDEPWKEPNIANRLDTIAPPLYYMSLTGLVGIVRLLLENGADINASGGFYGNALQAASRKGHSQIVQQLLENRANANALGGHYGNALHAASYMGHGQIVKQLLKNGAKPNAPGGRYGNALQAASYMCHGRIVQQLLEHGVDIDAPGGYYGSALHAASYMGHSQIVQQLLEGGASVNAPGAPFGNALQAASRKGHSQIVEQLLKNGANINALVGPYGNALQAAAHKGHSQTVEQLLKNGADISAPGFYENALQAASSAGHDQIVQQLKSALQSQ